MPEVSDTKQAINDPSFAAGMTLVVNALMKRLGVTEVTIDPVKECSGPGGAAVEFNKVTKEITVRLVDNYEEAKRLRDTNEFGNA